ncbi:hypothetical protein KSF_088430 [Reticulibacter mediterranei]|uniref:Uncharacterized protein n=1 Tax=Reticulibacter mediterranei TaxID=2778369 RepID=A0A8J3IUL0_9CHLR|nr:hypothetical protein [Reticulibacter mediterranei]GHO98795.1 hypothetical protein KSF_088430 [Reticulibacter mediterranei]
MINPQDLVDYWSSNTVIQPAAANEPISGLGKALEIARHKEKFLDPTILPEEFDGVIRLVRNNLVHLSGEALNTHLRMFDYRSAEKHYTLQNFLSDQELVFDFIRNVPRFITDPYNKLCRNNI